MTVSSEGKDSKDLSIIYHLEQSKRLKQLKLSFIKSDKILDPSERLEESLDYLPP